MEDYSRYNVEEIKSKMDERYRHDNAYTINIPWDEARMHDLNAKVFNYLGFYEYRHQKILEVCCGQGGTAAYLPDDADFTGVELSQVAVDMARSTFPQFRFEQMDACDLRFEDETFDTVIAKEAIEHLLDQRKALKEWHRVLKSCGRLILTTPNRDSLHLQMNRLLGFEDFKCSYDHTNELTFAEACQLLKKTGFEVVDHCGSFLMPYWGIPTVDGPVRELTDYNQDAIALLKTLGDRCGAEFAFCMVIKAVRY